MADEPFDPSKPLRSPKHEQFCISFVRKGNMADAYLDAGFGGSRKNARKSALLLSRRPEVAARIDWVQRQIASEVVAHNAGTRDWITKQLVENVGAAKTAGDLKAVNQALFYLGKEAGMFVDRQIVANLEREIDGKTEEELKAFLESLVDELGESTLRAVLAGRGSEAHDRGRESAQGGETARGADAEPIDALSPVSEAAGIPRSRIH